MHPEKTVQLHLGLILLNLETSTQLLNLEITTTPPEIIPIFLLQEAALPEVILAEAEVLVEAVVLAVEVEEVEEVNLRLI
jgi:hypothetical protein